MANQLKEELILNSSQFDKNINNVIKKVEELKNKGSKVGGGFETSMGKMIQKATGFNGSMGSLVGVIGKFSGALGVAMSAGEAFNKTIQSSQLLTDEMGKAQAGLTSMVDNFFQSLAAGDFSPFLNGMDNMISKAKEAFNAMDELWNMAQSFSVQNARLNNQFQQNLIEIRQKKGSTKEEDKKRVEQLKKENEDIIKRQAEGGVKLYNQTVSALQKEIALGTGMDGVITEGAIYRIVENDINNLKGGRKKYETEYNKYQAELEKLNNRYAAKYNSRQVGQGLISRLGHLNKKDNYGVEYQRELNKLQSKYGEAIAANYLLQRKSDAELEEFNNKLKQGIAYQGVSIANQSKMLRYTNEQNTEIKKTGGSGGKRGNGGIVYPENSIGWYEEQIKEIQKTIKVTVDTTEINKLNAIMAQLVKEKQALENPIRGKVMQGSAIGVSSIPTIDQIKETKPSQQFYTLEEYFEQYSKAASDVLRKLDIGIIGNDLAKELIDSINAQLQALGLKPLEIEIKTDAEKKLEGIGNQVEQLGTAFRGLGQGFELPALDIMGVIGQSIANVLLSYSQAMLKPKDPISWLTFGLMGLGEVAAIISQIHSLSGYANGGVIGGNSFAGDNLLIRANSGEMILNSFQQKHLFEMLDNGTTKAEMSNVHFVIRGRDLVGVFDNYNDKIRKVR